MTQELIELRAYIDRLEFLIWVCVALFAVGVVGIGYLLLTRGDHDEDR